MQQIMRQPASLPDGIISLLVRSAAWGKRRVLPVPELPAGDNHLAAPPREAMSIRVHITSQDTVENDPVPGNGEGPRVAPLDLHEGGRVVGKEGGGIDLRVKASHKPSLWSPQGRGHEVAPYGEAKPCRRPRGAEGGDLANCQHTPDDTDTRSRRWWRLPSCSHE